jgi:hypothetical protein
MLYKCVNPACSVPFRRLNEGKLFVVQMPSEHRFSKTAIGQKRSGLRKVKHYWMCDDCARHLTLVFDAERGIETVPLPTARKPVVSAHGGPAVPRVAAGMGRGRLSE